MSPASAEGPIRGIEEIPDPVPELWVADADQQWLRRVWPRLQGAVSGISWMRRQLALGDARIMSTHVHGLTVTVLADASRAARTVDHAVTLVDDASHVIVVVDQRGRVTVRPADRHALN
jgi:hypothetical protein